jgi:hypothetical protein
LTNFGMATCHVSWDAYTIVSPARQPVSYGDFAARMSGLVELPQQQRLDRVGLGAALRALHHLAHEELYGGGSARAIVLG